MLPPPRHTPIPKHMLQTLPSTRSYPPHHAATSPQPHSSNACCHDPLHLISPAHMPLPCCILNVKTCATELPFTHLLHPHCPDTRCHSPPNTRCHAPAGPPWPPNSAPGRQALPALLSRCLLPSEPPLAPRAAVR
eukprot:scaffold95658_cov20-Tisochrysis_lutea.AAC.3